jgi:hypothetical protein
VPAVPPISGDNALRRLSVHCFDTVQVLVIITAIQAATLKSKAQDAYIALTVVTGVSALLCIFTGRTGSPGIALATALLFIIRMVMVVAFAVRVPLNHPW